MKLSKYLAGKRGRGVAIAKLLKVEPPTVYQYASGRRVPPPNRCIEIENATAGKVTRRDLRTDWEFHWPELKALHQSSKDKK